MSSREDMAPKSADSRSPRTRRREAAANAAENRMRQRQAEQPINTTTDTAHTTVATDVDFSTEGGPAANTRSRTSASPEPSEGRKRSAEKDHNDAPPAKRRSTDEHGGAGQRPTVRPAHPSQTSPLVNRPFSHQPGRSRANRPVQHPSSSGTLAPVNVPVTDRSQLLQHDICAIYRSYKAYWRAQYDRRPRRRYHEITTVLMLPQEDVNAAIASVTEAITDEAKGNLGPFSLVNVNTFQLLVGRFPVEPLMMAARPGARLIIPWTVAAPPRPGERANADGHTWLVTGEIAHRPNRSRFISLKHYDSALDMRNPGAVTRSALRHPNIEKVIMRNGWASQGLPMEHQQCHASKQRLGNYCGFHTVLNGWALAMGLALNTSFSPTQAFYDQGPLLLNMAYSGCIDSTTIWAFLLCEGYIAKREGDHILTDPFSKTFPIPRGGDLGSRISDIQEQQLLAGGNDGFDAGPEEEQDIVMIRTRFMSSDMPEVANMSNSEVRELATLYHF
ncbi:hypothetical protein EJ08DRAFT_698680 [Tothia fuscella]|uniref:Uncharacterized protein n=1 Tax=Tothia fuscella TaxID=1048955 RepID=A0A9P4NP53_9PEZI|nr:hypothetical protein EJ08DRAFT_698680 [Tothia fuscella]